MTRMLILVRTWLGSLFLYSAVLKLMEYKQAGAAVKRYAVLPERVAVSVGVALPWAELVAATLLISGRLFPWGPLLAASLGGSFTFAARTVVQRGANVTCGCAGEMSSNVTQTTVRRGIAIAVASLLLIPFGQHRHKPLPKLSSLSSIGLGMLVFSLTLFRKAQHSRFHQLNQERNMQQLDHLSRVLQTTSFQSETQLASAPR